MRYTSSFKRVATLATITVAIGMSNSYAMSLFDYLVQVRNSSNKKLTKVLASTDGENYSPVSIGNGIKPAQTLEIDWNTSNGQNCNWYLKAFYADTSESAPQHVDLCSNDVVIEFK